MLEFCAANLIAEDDQQTKFLTEIASFAGFGKISCTLTNKLISNRSQKTELNFFLFHFQMNIKTIEKIVHSVRHSVDDEVRFSPILLIANDIPFDQYMNFIQLGFDDIISLPEKGAMIVSRLSNQVGKEMTYFETVEYFGPDRRRMEIEPPKNVERAAVPHSHSQILFRRDPVVGTKILRRLVILPQAREKARHTERQLIETARGWPAKDFAR